MQMSVARLAAIVLVMALVGCRSESRVAESGPDPRPNPRPAPVSLVSGPLADRSRSDAETMFSPVTCHGIDFVNRLHPENEVVYLTNGSGLAIGDLDNDGLADVVLAGLNAGNRLYRQVRPFVFEDRTKDSGLQSSDDAVSAGVAMADVNNDGWLDIYICNYLSKNELYLNCGDGTFEEVGRAWNADQQGPTMMASFMDYDRDGDLDVYLVNNRRYKVEDEDYFGKIGRTPGGQIVAPPDMFVEMSGHMVRSGHKDLLLRNNGNGFTDVTDEAGIDGYGMGLSATWWDVNGDHWPDLWVANDLKMPDHLYVNQGDGTFVDTLPQATTYTTWNSMGADFADFNNDGLFDFLIADMSATTHFKEKVNMGDMSAEAWFMDSAEPRQVMRNCLFVNSGTGPFLETAFYSGVARTDWTWAVKCEDFDCDGQVDIFVTNGVVGNVNDADWLLRVEELLSHGQAETARALKPPPLKEKNLSFRNTGQLRFEDVSAGWGLDHQGISHGAALGDLDNDGDLDLIVQNYGEPIGVYRNDSTANCLTVSLAGQQSNRFGVGAVVTIETSAGCQQRMLSPARGYLSTDQPILHFGLGDDDKVRHLTVQWPSGIRQSFDDLDANRHVHITEDGAADGDTTSQPEPGHRLFAASPALTDVRHLEMPFDDFSGQTLLPNRLSTLGPGLAWADFNGDSREDVFVGGGSFQSGQLLANQGDGQFELAPGPWSEHAKSEDLGIAWLDVDSDGDPDLYVGSGSNECPAGDPLLQDHLYINQGQGQFVDQTSQWLPDRRESTGAVRVGDFDSDGDPDLFVGSRQVPGEYPKAPGHVLLRNTGSAFEDCTAEIAPSLASAGMVTDAQWTDTNNDGWLDLALTSEWGPVHLLVNHDGRLQAAGSSDHSVTADGWWNGLSAADLDGNGFVDFVVSNFGTNTKYGKPSAEKPRKLFFGDVDGNGTIDLIEAKVDDNDQLLPVRGRSCSCQQIPALSEKFPSYREFASAGLLDIYPLDQTEELVCQELQSVVLMNDGAGHFEIKPLPTLAQLAPAFGTVVADFDLDGIPDIFMVQNFYGPQIETGRMSGGLGVLLRGLGDGEFSAIWPNQSGVVIPQDARAVSLADLDDDCRPDVVVSVSNGNLISLVNQAPIPPGSVQYKIVVSGPRGNPAGSGAIISLRDGESLIASRRIGGNTGYLGQSSGSVFLSAARTAGEPRIRIVWPDGRVQEQPVPRAGGRIDLRYANIDTAGR